MKTLLYCQHSIGMGHLVRTLQLADALAALGPVALICGGRVPDKVAQRHDFPLYALPALRMSAEGAMVRDEGPDAAPVDTPHYDRDADGAIPIEQLLPDAGIVAERIQRMRGIVADTVPDVLVIEMFPLGRKKLAEELLDLIDSARRVNPACRVVCSVRDVLVTLRRDQARFDRVAIDRLNRQFDLLLVHADPALIRLDETLGGMQQLRIPVAYTGYIAKPVTLPDDAPLPRVIVTSGSGRVGATLNATVRDTARLLYEELGLSTVLVTGPLHRESTDDVTPAPWLSTVDYLPDLPGELARSRLSISQCGYNTATDILGARVASVLVPFEAERENEQILRARALERRGIATVLREAELSPANLLDAARRALSREALGKPDSVRLDGLAGSRRALQEFMHREAV